MLLLCARLCAMYFDIHRLIWYSQQQRHVVWPPPIFFLSTDVYIQHLLLFQTNSQGKGPKPQEVHKMNGKDIHVNRLSQYRTIMKYYIKGI